MVDSANETHLGAKQATASAPDQPYPYPVPACMHTYIQSLIRSFIQSIIHLVLGLPSKICPGVCKTYNGSSATVRGVETLLACRVETAEKAKHRIRPTSAVALVVVALVVLHKSKPQSYLLSNSRLALRSLNATNIDVSLNQSVSLLHSVLFEDCLFRTRSNNRC